MLKESTILTRRWVGILILFPPLGGEALLLKALLRLRDFFFFVILFDFEGLQRAFGSAKVFKMESKPMIVSWETILEHFLVDLGGEETEQDILISFSLGDSKCEKDEIFVSLTVLEASSYAGLVWL